MKFYFFIFSLALILIFGSATAREYPPVFRAVYKNDMEVFEEFIESGGDINIRRPGRSNQPGTSLLLATIDNSRHEMASILVKSGANIEMRELTHALNREEGDIFRLFYPHIKGLDKESLDQLLILASLSSYEGYLQIVQDLLGFGAQAEAQIKPEIEGRYPCVVTPVSGALIALENNGEYALDAQLILNALIETIEESSGENRGEILEKYEIDPEAYDCNLYD